MADKQDPTPPPSDQPVKRKPGRPPGKWKKPEALKSNNRVLGEVVRDSQDPWMLVKFQQMVVQGKNPIFNEKMTDVIEDPSPNAQPPNLAERRAAVQWLSDRGWGTAPQAVQVSMDLKASIAPEIPMELMQALSPMQLNLLAQALLPAPVSKDEDIVDAEYIMQETSQVPSGKDSSDS